MVHGEKNSGKSGLFRLLCWVIPIVVVIAVGAVAVNGFSAGEDGETKKDILGTWQFGAECAYVFEYNGKGTLQMGDEQYPYTYSARNGHLKMDFDDEQIMDCEYEFTCTDTELTLIGGEGTDGGTYSLSKAK